MAATLKLFATLGERLPASTKANGIPIEIGPQSTVLSVIQAHGPDERLCHLVLLNGVFVSVEDRAKEPVRDGDVLAIWPPIGGG